jgi:hypothetical protein
MNAYRIHRTKLQDLYVSPYLGEGKMDPQENVVIRSDAPLDQHARDEISIALFSDIDYAVDEWIMNKRYIPRLLATTAVFLAVYFFGSLAVRDPVPMVDELAVSIVISIVFWRFISRRDVASAVAIKEKSELKNNVSSAMVEIDSSLLAVEDFLTSLEAMGHDDLADKIIKKEFRFTWTDPQLKSLLIAYAGVHQKATYEWYGKVTGKIKHPELFSVRLADDILDAKVDGPLLGLLCAL